MHSARILSTSSRAERSDPEGDKEELDCSVARAPKKKPTPKVLISIPFFCAFAPEDWIASSQALLAKTW
jgi:hypothetical protein